MIYIYIYIKYLHLTFTFLYFYKEICTRFLKNNTYNIKNLQINLQNLYKRHYIYYIDYIY